MKQQKLDPHRLYIGVNYHPHDWPEERWPVDIAMMKEAGFDTVRLGHLCWDSFEPADGQYDFSWFDQVMALCAQAGIGVVLDIPMRPAPVWVHRLCPGSNIGAKAVTPYLPCGATWRMCRTLTISAMRCGSQES